MENLIPLVELFNSSGELQVHWLKHNELLRTNNGPTSSFWFSFLEMMDILFHFRHSLKTGDWEGHLEATRMMIPYFFAYDRQNYSRFLTYYWSDMTQLQQTHPRVYDEFM